MNIGNPPYKIGERIIETPDWEKSQPSREPSQQPEREVEREREKVPAE